MKRAAVCAAACALLRPDMSLAGAAPREVPRLAPPEAVYGTPSIQGQDLSLSGGLPDSLPPAVVPGPQPSAAAQPDPVVRQEHIHGGDPRGIFAAAIDPKGGEVATTGFEGIVRLWDLHGGLSRLALSDDPTGAIFALAFDNAGRRVATGAKDGSVHILGVQDGSRLVLPGHPHEPGSPEDYVRSVAFSPDGRLVAGGSEAGAVRVWDSSDGSLLSRMSHPAAVMSLSFSPDGFDLAAVERRGGVHLWDVGLGVRRLPPLGELLEQELQVSERAHLDAKYGAAFSPDGRMLAVSGPGGHAVRIWDIASQRIARVLLDQAHPEWMTQLAFSADGRFLAGGDVDGDVQVWDMATGELVFQRRFEYSIVALRFEPKDHRLTVFDRDGGITELRVRPR